MRIRRTVILAAGSSGSRLRRLSADRPTPLLAIAGRTLIDRQIEALESCGVREITVVVGYREERLREHLGNRVSFVCNDRYQETNSLYSLWLAADRLQGGTFVLNGDVVFSPLLLDVLRWHPAPDALIFDPRRTLGPDAMKVRLAGPYVVDIGRHIPPGQANGENLGLLKFGEDGALRLADVLERLVAAGEVNAGVPRAVVELAHRWPVVAVDADGLPWTEIDDPEDLAYANQVDAPAMGAWLPPGTQCGGAGRWATARRRSSPR